MATTRVSRNEPCPCGSGRKFKKCCLLTKHSTPGFSWPTGTTAAGVAPRSCGLGHLAIGSIRPQDVIERHAERRRTIVMRMDFPDGRWCDIELLRPIEWIERQEVQPVATIFLDLTEVGVRGWAQVLKILPCPHLQEFGDGEIVTGTFKYSHGRVGELILESESQPISVTPFHLFWSEDRASWVPVCELCPGEMVNTLDGLTRVVSFKMTDRIEPVYNIEVASDHCYRVGESGVLVHNQSVGNSNDPCCGLTIIKFSLTGNASNIAKHIQAAQQPPPLGKGRGPFTHDTNKANQNRRREDACPTYPKPRGGCPRAGDPATHTSCDEYPFASSTSGGAGASTKCVPLDEQKSQGGIIRTSRLAHGQKYCVEVVP